MHVNMYVCRQATSETGKLNTGRQTIKAAIMQQANMQLELDIRANKTGNHIKLPIFSFISGGVASDLDIEEVSRCFHLGQGEGCYSGNHLVVSGNCN